MKVIVKNARLSFNDLFTAKAFQGGKPKFSATLICLDGSDPSELTTTITYKGKDDMEVSKEFDALQNVCDHVAKEKWGKVPPKMKNWAFNIADGSTTRNEFSNSDGEMWAGFEPHTWYISASKQEEQCTDGVFKVLDQIKRPIAANSGLIFSGCYVNAVIDVYAYDGKDGKGVTASLEGIQLKMKGQPLGITRIDAADEFDEEEIDESIENDADDLI